MKSSTFKDDKDSKLFFKCESRLNEMSSTSFMKDFIKTI